jgi:hypothetical protein
VLIRINLIVLNSSPMWFVLSPDSKMVKKNKNQMKTDKVVSFDKLGFTIFILDYKCGTGLP